MKPLSITYRYGTYRCAAWDWLETGIRGYGWTPLEAFRDWEVQQ